MLSDPRSRPRPTRWWSLTPTLLAVALAGCAEGSPMATVGNVVCDLDPELLRANVGPDAIPALTEPEMVAAADPDAAYLDDSDRVLGVYVDGEARAYPHNILWYHEVVNDRIGDRWLSVTFCPLTGSGLAFDPTIGARRLELGVSGLLFANNLVLFDRLTEAVYGPQLTVDGACGDFRTEALDLFPVQEMSWGQWRRLHPGTSVVSGLPVHGFDYRRYPYGSYDQISSNQLLVPMRVDRSRLIKERVLAIRDGSGGLGFPYGELRALGETAAINQTVAGVPTVVLYDADEGEVALAFDARHDGGVLTFRAVGAGRWVDLETGSTWRIDGSASEGPLAGARLATRADAYTLFWFAWRHFQPDGEVFIAP